jgi:hypothetical protein
MTVLARTPSIAPLSIAYETEHCFVRDLVVTDACDTICNWLSDPQVAKALNAPVGALSMDELRRYIAGHDGINGHLVGVFRRDGGDIIGLWSLYVDWEQSEFLVNVLLPGNVDGELGVFRETGRQLYRIMFEDRGLGAMRYNVLASNHRMQERLAVPGDESIARPEHVSRTASAGGTGQEELRHYRMTREQYFEVRARRAERDAIWRQARKAREEGNV